MKSVPLHNKKVLQLPDCWDDLTPQQYIFTVKQLLLLQAQYIDPSDFRMRLMKHYTGYKPSRKSYWRNKENPGEITREVIAYNLVQLADMITFPFQNDKLSLYFTTNPLPEIKGLGVGKKFTIGVVPVTNILAGEYADALDIVAAHMAQPADNLLNTLVAILYPAAPVHTLEAAQLRAATVARQPYAVRYAVYLWFLSISHYFSSHPYYSLLYAGKPKDENATRLSLGSNESIIHLSQKGYGSHAEMRAKNLIEFMDMQLSDLRACVREMQAYKVKPLEIVEKTGLTLTQIELLSS